MSSQTRPDQKSSHLKKSSFLRIIMSIIALSIVTYSLYFKYFKINQLSWAQEKSSANPEKNLSEIEVDETEDWAKLKELKESLSKKENEIKEKNRLLEQQEQRLSLVKQEIIQEIESLKSLKKEIQQKLQQVGDQQEKRLRELSKVFEGSPPEQAGSIIEATDPSTAAELIIRMDKRKAGKMWGYVDPIVAAEITKIITEKDKIDNLELGKVKGKP